jgi:hypothetical protein
VRRGTAPERGLPPMSNQTLQGKRAGRSDQSLLGALSVARQDMTARMVYSFGPKEGLKDRVSDSNGLKSGRIC